MTKRKVVAMEKQEDAGKVIYEKRKRTLEKKAQDLSTLCGISVCTLCFDPNGKVNTWPQDPYAVRGILERYTAKRDANQIWELTETETAPAPATNQNQNLDKDKTKKKKDDEEEEKNQNHKLEKDNENEKEEEDDKEEEEKNVTVNPEQVREDRVERRRLMLKRWEIWGSRLEEREDLSQVSLKTIAKALDYKLRIANGMIGLKEIIRKGKLGIHIGDSASTSNSRSTAANDTEHRYQDQSQKHEGISHGICGNGGGTTPVGDGSSSSHDPDNNSDSNLVLGDQNHDLHSNFAASRPPQFFRFF